MPGLPVPGVPVPDAPVPGLLAREFFEPPALQVAPLLLGCVLRRDSPEGTVAAVITEVEAYAGPDDPASHAYRGQTPRNAVMFGPPGHVYVYFTYGMHFCANLVCEPAGAVSAILLRAGRITEGAALAASRRWPGAGPGPERDLARGPARLCQALGVGRAQNGADACDPGSELRVCPAPAGGAAGGISTGPRIGISQAADRPWRFWLAGEPSVTPYKKFAPRRARGITATGPARGDGTMHR